jgi:hypothetical protein
MAKPQEADPVKLFVAALWARPEALGSAIEELGSYWGEIDFTGDDHPFDTTDHYEPEMGRNLNRRIISFRKLVPPDILPEAKHICNQIEDRLAGTNGRQVNLDVGYLDHNKIVLASFKAAGQKVYLKDGVWADLVARYRQGKYRPFEWTFPDFRDDRYSNELLRIRWAYLRQIR